MKVWVNGEEKEMTAAPNVALLVAELGLPAPAVLIEHNGVALRRSDWEACGVAEGDRVEILRIAAGG